MYSPHQQANRQPVNGTFPTTHWTVVNALRQPSHEGRESLLTDFIERYTPAFRMHLIHGRGYRHEADLEDTIQGFLTDKFVLRNILEYVQEGKGRLRDYLRRCLDHYVYEQHRSKASAAWDQRVGLDEANLDVAEASHPEQTCPFDAAWAHSVVTETVSRTKAQFCSSDRQHVWEIFHHCIVIPLFTNKPAVPYSEIAESTGLTIKAVRNRRVTALRAFGKHLTAVVAEYVGNDPDRIESEINDIKQIMRSALFQETTTKAPIE